MFRNLSAALVALFLLCLCGNSMLARDLEDIRADGVLRHLGVPYANFNTGDGHGLDVELMQRFAASLGLRYEYVASDWNTIINDLVGKQVKPQGDAALLLGEAPVRGDIIANGLTVLPWRQQVLTYSSPTFPTQVWLIAAAGSSMQPITASGSLEQDIAAVKKLLAGKSVLGKNNTCLAPELYFLAEADARTLDFEGGLNDLAPAVIQGRAESALLDVPDTLVALSKWPGQIKVLGPVSEPQEMGVAFRKDSPKLHAAFEDFFRTIWRDGRYRALVEKYYPDVFTYYPEFFARP
ncbi:MAG: ABC transporter substrate-binding protein [Desulfobulbaceae bacterium A2]|nr:MAG: ABC transporter substrate-binding protein [Desulfobulbaceae bacterium A2]